MDIRIGFSAVFFLIVVALAYCGVNSLRSHKNIGRAVGMLDLALIPPLLGNLMIIGTSVERLAVIGYYIYFLGMNIVMTELVQFTAEYCKGIGNGQQKPTVVYYALLFDTVQMLLNTVFGHAFDVEPVDVQGKDYFRIIPHFGQAIHRVVDYAVFGAVILMFILASVKTARLFRERFTIILVAMVIIGLWQTFYIFSRTPVDRSMIGYGVFGLLITYFSLYYRPLRLLDRTLSGIVADMSEGLLVFDPTGKCIWANEHGLKIIGLDNGELENVPNAMRAKFGDHEYSMQEWSENRVIGVGNDAKYYTIENHTVSDDGKHIAGSFLSLRDNTEEQRRLKKEFYNSTHDSLTGLYTKQYLYDCIRKKLDLNKDTEYTAVFIDVKNFKIVNDVFGSDFGDKALQQLADWVSSNMNSMCVYGRLAGDTFGVLLPTEQFENDRDTIEDTLSNFVVKSGNIEHHLLVHIGAYEVDEREIDISVMFDRAHLALSAINDDYKTHIAYYDKKLRERVLWDQRITTELHNAISQRQLIPYLQPITDKRGRVVGAEALARWIHPEHGFLSPAVFIPVFEKSGLIVEVDRHIWRCACELLSQWKGKFDDMFISVNISPKDFYYCDVSAEIKELVSQYDIEPSKLRIEITETVMMNDAEDKMRILDDLRKSGFIVEMDDFGSGYSSLNLLKDMPVDVLKLDMKFLSCTNEGDRSQTILETIIDLTEKLDISSLTEGVETKEQFMMLNEMGCRLFQGYYFAKPMPSDDFEVFVNEKNIAG